MATHQFDTEVAKAVQWVVTALLPSDSSFYGALTDALREALRDRYVGHWYPDEPHRGCAYRSLTCNGTRLDPLVQQAARQAKLPPGEVQLAEGFILWCNPSEVKVLLDSGTRQDIFRVGTKASNPYSRAKVEIEPTRLNVVAEDPISERSRSSSASSSPKAKSVGLSPHAAEFAPAAARTGESESESEAEPEAATQQYAPASAMPAPPGLLLPPGMPINLMGMPPLPPPAAPPQQQQMWPVTSGSSWQPYGQYAVEAH